MLLLHNYFSLLQAKIDSMLGSQCLYCGDVMIMSVSQPLVPPENLEKELLNWKWVFGNWVFCMCRLPIVPYWFASTKTCFCSLFMDMRLAMIKMAHLNGLCTIIGRRRLCRTIFVPLCIRGTRKWESQTTHASNQIQYLPAFSIW